MGLHWIIRKRLSTQPVYYLTDLVLAATRVEQLMEKERKKLWKLHREQGITIESSTYTTVSKMGGPFLEGTSSSFQKNKN